MTGVFNYPTTDYFTDSEKSLIDWSVTTQTYFHCVRDGCKGSRKSLKVTPKSDIVLAKCHRCGCAASYRSDWKDRLKPDYVPPARSAPVENPPRLLSAAALDWFHGLAPISGVAYQYLTSRRCVIPPADGDLKWHPNLKHPSGYSGAALVGLITDALTGQAMSLHRTWIKPDGTKADVDPPRLVLAGHQKKGGVIRLWHDTDVTTGLALGEGIESMLSFAHAYQPCWSAIDAGNLGSFPLLGGIESLTIVQDMDPAGMKAAQALADRYQAAGVEVFITEFPCNDANDFIMGDSNVG